MSQLDDRGPFQKPRREPKEPPLPKPPVNRPAPIPAPAPRPPQPPPPPPEDGDGTRGPVFKPRPEPKETAPPSTISGPIGDRWRRLGGKSWGIPAFAPMSTGDGRGLWVDFTHPGGSSTSIVWAKQTGAWLIGGDMRNAWNRLGRESGVLGYPTSDSLVAHDGVGRYQTFESGLLVWHPSIGAKEVHGAILGRYGQLGGSAFGYPITDESVAGRDGRGRFNHFREMPSGAEKSIYWSPDTDAHEVYGLIRSRWQELGWENGYLGYPTSGELPWSGAPGGRVSTFTGGTIFYSPRHGAYPDPMKWIHFIREGGFKGQVEVTANSAGTVELTGYVRSSAAVGYEYLVQSMLRSSDNMAVPFTHSGTVTSTHGSDEKDEIRGRVDSPVVATNYGAFATGTLVVDENHRNRFTGSLGALVEGLITWTAGSLVLTPGTAALLVVGTEAVSVATSGSLVPGARIISGTMWLAGPAGTLFALAADGLTRLASNERTLRPAEYDHANLVFKGSLPPRDKIMVSDSVGGGKRPFTYPRFDGKVVLNMGDDFGRDLHTLVAPGHPQPGQLLIHEITHAWQYHNNAASISYVGDAIWARVREDYDEGSVLDESWDSFGLEEQASIVEHWYERHYSPVSGANTDYGLGTSGALIDQAFRFIRDNIRTGRN